MNNQCKRCNDAGTNWMGDQPDEVCPSCKGQNPLIVQKAKGEIMPDYEKLIKFAKAAQEFEKIRDEIKDLDLNDEQKVKAAVKKYGRILYMELSPTLAAVFEADDETGRPITEDQVVATHEKELQPWVISMDVKVQAKTEDQAIGIAHTVASELEKLFENSEVTLI